MWRVVIEGLDPQYGLSVDFSIYDQQDEDGEPSITGSIKWDGCMNWQTNPNCMGHFCSPNAAATLGGALASVWPLAKPCLGDKADINYGK